MFGKKAPQQDPDQQFFVIFDAKVGHYWEPRPALNQHEVLRALDARMRDGKSDDVLFTNAEDFQLFKIADYYKKTASLISHEPVHIANLHEIKAVAKRQVEQAGH